MQHGAWFYPKVPAEREMADGSFLPAMTWQHPDPSAEAVRWRICEGGLVQAIGRARGIWRTNANPLRVLALTDAVLDMPVNEFVEDASLDPSPCDEMLAAGGMAFSKTDAATAYRNLWPNAEALKKRQQRWNAAHPDGSAEKGGTKAYSVSSIGKCPPLAVISYRLPGRPGDPLKASYLPGAVPEPVARLTELLGIAPSWWAIEKQPMAEPLESALAEPQAPTEPEPAPVPTRPSPRPIAAAHHASSTMVAALSAMRPLGMDPPAPQRPP